MNKVFEGRNGCREIRYCNKCLTPDSRPRIHFNQEGVCNACQNAETKYAGIDWEERKREFLEIVDRYKSRDGHWDCVVPWSGGKDSSTIAWKLKYEFGLNPVLVTFSPMMLTEVGAYNRELMIQAGFDNLFLRPNQKVHRRLAKRFFIERGNQKVAWEAGKEATPVQTALRYNIPLVFYAEHGESEYGGKVLHNGSLKIKDFTEVVENLVGDDARNWVDEEITNNDLNPYVYPNMEDIRRAGMQIYYFAYFFNWSMFENYKYIKEKIPFKVHPAGRTVGTFTNFDSLDDKMDALYYYMQFIKFGFGRAVRDASRMIQNGHISRAEGLQYAREYDHEYPHEDINEVLDYLNLSEEEFHKIIDKHRNQEIWKNENGVWTLRYPLPGN